jgi:peptidylprolyl isomerase
MTVAGVLTPGEPVATVGGLAITDAAFTHWETIANDANQASTGVGAPPLPVPPDYSACVAALRAQSSTASDSVGVLEGLCAKNYRALRTEVMNFLVQAIWIEGEAKVVGVSVTAAQVDASFAAQRKSSKPPLVTTSELNAFLAKSGQTVADLRWRTRLNLLATAIQTKVDSESGRVTEAQIAAYYTAHLSQYKTESLQAATPTIRRLIVNAQRKKANAALSRMFSVTWRNRTVCRAGFDASKSCSRTSRTLAADPQAPYPGAIVPPTSMPQLHAYHPTSTSAPAPSRPTTVKTPATGPLAHEPTISLPTGAPPTTLTTSDLIAGSGAVASPGDTVTVNYVGALYANGKVFDSSWARGQTFTTALTDAAVIRGWVQGIAGMRVGGRRELIIPPALAYKDVAQGPIPAGSTLIFIVDLLAVSR